MKAKNNRIDLPLNNPDKFSLVQIRGEVDFNQGTRMILKSKSLKKCHITIGSAQWQRY